MAVTPPPPDPVAAPLTPREMVSPSTVTLTLEAKLPATVGANRTVTVRLAPEARENELPDTMLNGAPTLTDPDRLTGPVFWIVNVLSTVVPVVTLPKFVAVAGCDAEVDPGRPAGARLEQALSFPLVSTALTRDDIGGAGRESRDVRGDLFPGPRVRRGCLDLEERRIRGTAGGGPEVRCQGVPRHVIRSQPRTFIRRLSAEGER